jgi:hypothetical protein
MRVVSTAAFAGILGAIALGGCTGTKAVKPEAAPARVVPGWRAVLRDWSDNGRFDERHPCSAVREAVTHLPVTRLPTALSILT